jgi:hypothetical protein
MGKRFALRASRPAWACPGWRALLGWEHASGSRRPGSFIAVETISAAELDRITNAEVRGRPQRRFRNRADVGEPDRRTPFALTSAFVSKRSRGSPTGHECSPSEAITPPGLPGRSDS